MDFARISEEHREELIKAASAAMENAWCPYSRFSVGAAILMSDGEIVTGCNVENSSFGLTNCAERTAVFSAITKGYGSGDFLSIVVRTQGAEPSSPCGACRQVLSEFFSGDAVVVAVGDGGKSMTWTVKELLPDGFRL